MKSLKKLAVIAALSSAMNAGAVTDQKEVNYTPDTLNGVNSFEISDLKMVNGQLMVESTGKSADSKTYMMVGTNTQNFANSAFAKGCMGDATVMADDGKDLYMMRSGNETNVFHTAVSEKPALNGMVNPVDALTTNDVRAAAVIKARKSGKKVIIDGDDVFTISEDGQAVAKNGESCNYTPEMAKPKKPIDDIVVAYKKGYAIVDGKLYGVDNGELYYGLPVDSVSMTEDRNHLNIISGSKFRVYDATTNKFDASLERTITPISGTDKVKAAVKAGDIIYYATKTKLGYIKD